MMKKTVNRCSQGLVLVLLGVIAVACTTGSTAYQTDQGRPSSQAAVEVDSALVGELLMRGAEDGENDVIRFALASGADIDARDPASGKTPLILATERGHVRTVAILIENGARIERRSAEDWTPLVYAAARGQPDVARLLIGAGADIEAREPSGGYTPLLIAALLGQADLIAPLIDAGADVNARSEQSGASALAIAAAGSSNSLLDTMAELLISGAALESRDNGGATPLIAAVKANNTDAVNLLLAAGADPMAVDLAGVSAADVARDQGREDILALLDAAV